MSSSYSSIEHKTLDLFSFLQMNNQNSKSTVTITTKANLPTMDHENKQQFQSNEATIDNLSMQLDEKVNAKELAGTADALI